MIFADRDQKMRVLVIGGGGQLGSKILHQGRTDFDLHATYMTRPPPIEPRRIHRLDKTDRQGIQKLISTLSPDVVVDTAALHNVDYCESHKNEAQAINVMGTRNIAEVCREIRAKMVFISTDYVFDGTKGNYTEDEPINPINYYGVSKVEGERAVQQSCDDYIVVRPSVIYGWVASSLPESSSGKPLNFAMWLTRKLKDNERISIVTDQYSSPTLSDDLAKAIIELCKRDAKGLYHVAGRMRLSRYEFALKLAERMSLDSGLVTPIGTSQLKQVARRPADSSLNVKKIERNLGRTMLTVDEALEVYRRQASMG